MSKFNAILKLLIFEPASSVSPTNSATNSKFPLKIKLNHQLFEEIDNQLNAKMNASIATKILSNSSVPSSSSSTPSISTASNNLFSKSHIHQAIRLAHDALDEQDKGSSLDQDYALDCYLASLEYFLSAIPSNSHSLAFSGSHDRQSIIYTKLNHLLSKAKEFQSFNDLDHNPLLHHPSNHLNHLNHQQIQPTQLCWKDSLSNKFFNLASHLSSNPIISSPPQSTYPSDLVAQCHCGRKVLVQIPDWLMSSDQIISEDSNHPFNHHPTWPDTLVSIIFSIILMFRKSSLPHLITLSFTSFFSMIIYLESRFKILDLIISALIKLVEWLWKLNQDLHLHRRIGDGISYLISNLLRTALAISKGPSASASPPNPQNHPSSSLYYPSPPNPQNHPSSSLYYPSPPRNLSNSPHSFTHSPPQFNRKNFAKSTNTFPRSHMRPKFSNSPLYPPHY